MWEDRFFLAVSLRGETRKIFFLLDRTVGVQDRIPQNEHGNMGSTRKKAAVFGRFFFLLMHPFWWWTNGKPGREVEWTQKGTQMRH